MSKELKSCPFCGSEDIEIYYDDFSDYWIVECRECGVERNRGWNEDDAIEFWNTRPSEDEKDKEITKLKEDLEIQKNLTRQACFESNRAYEETEKWKKMFYDLVDKQATVDTNPKVVIIGKDTDFPNNATDNNGGSTND